MLSSRRCWVADDADWVLRWVDVLFVHRVPYYLGLLLLILILFADPPMDSGPFNVNPALHSKFWKTVETTYDCEQNTQQHLFFHRAIQFKTPFCAVWRFKAPCWRFKALFCDLRCRFFSCRTVFSYLFSDFVRTCFCWGVFKDFVCFDDLRCRFHDLRHRVNVFRCRFEI
jgi:hypothetical protein